MKFMSISLSRSNIQIRKDTEGMERQSHMFAIATLVMNGNKYVSGAVALANSLRLFSKATLVCMVTSDVTERQPLLDVFDEVVDVNKISVQAPPMATEGMERVYRSWINDSPTKWNILGLDRFDKVLFMDSDMIAIAPIDELFLLDVPAAAFDSHFARRYVADERYAFQTTLQLENVYGDLQHGEGVLPGVIQNIIDTQAKVFFPNGGLVLIAPSKFAMNLFLRDIERIAALSPGSGGVDEWSIMVFYHENGYTWHHISMEYNVAAYHTYQIFGERTKVLHYITQYKPWTEKEADIRREYPIHLDVYNMWWRMYRNTYIMTANKTRDLRRHLAVILGPILGERTHDVLDKYIGLYQQAFTTKEANPVANYELLEAYGDRFLAGQYAWLLIRTPGIIMPDQVTKISSHFQNEFALDQVCDFLELTRYIVLGRGESLSTAIKSDVVEALIGAIGISWQNTHRRGDAAMRSFIFRVWNQIFNIDVQNYRLVYEDPKTRFKQLVEQLQVNRNLITSTTRTTSPQEGRGDLIVTIMYGQYPVGVGRVSTEGVYRNTAVRMAERAAYMDALQRNSLQMLLNSQSIQ